MSPLSEHVQRQIGVMMEDDNVETGERVMLINSINVNGNPISCRIMKSSWHVKIQGKLDMKCKFTSYKTLHSCNILFQ